MQGGCKAKACRSYFEQNEKSLQSATEMYRAMVMGSMKMIV